MGEGLDICGVMVFCLLFISSFLCLFPSPCLLPMCLPSSQFRPSMFIKAARHQMPILQCNYSV